MLKTEQHTEKIRRQVAAAARKIEPRHHHVPTFEHGQWWTTCLECGAQFSVADAESGTSVNGFDLEQVTEGDGLSCN